MTKAFYPPARPLTVGEALDLAFQIFKATLVKSLPYGISAMIAWQLPNIYDLSSEAHVPQLFGGGGPISVALFLLSTLLTLIVWSSLLLRQRAIIEHTPTTTRSELAATLRRLPSFLLATLLVLVVVCGELAVLLVIPRAYQYAALVPLFILSSYLTVLLSCVWPAALLMGEPPLGALRQSVRLVRGNWWRVSAVYIVGVVVVLVLAILVGALIAIIMPVLTADVSVMTAVFTVVANALGAVIVPFVGALLLAVFGDLRVRKEGIDLQQRIVSLSVE